MYVFQENCHSQYNLAHSQFWLYYELIDLSLVDSLMVSLNYLFFDTTVVVRIMGLKI